MMAAKPARGTAIRFGNGAGQGVVIAGWSFDGRIDRHGEIGETCLVPIIGHATQQQFRELSSKHAIYLPGS